MYTPWHNATVDVSGTSSLKGAIEKAELNWKVRKCNININFDENDVIENAPFKAVVREDTKTVFTVVSPSYDILQNEDAFTFFEPLSKSGLIRLDRAGSTKGGRKIFVVAKPLKDGKEMPVVNHRLSCQVMFVNSHDRTSDVSASVFCLRKVSDTRQVVVGRPVTILRHRHTKKLKSSVDASVEALKKGVKAMNSIVESCDLMAHMTLNNEEALTTYLHAAMGTKDPKDEKTYNKKRMNEIKKIFKMRNGASMLDAYSAISEYVCWEAGRTNDNRIDSALFGVGSTLIQAAYRAGVELSSQE